MIRRCPVCLRGADGTIHWNAFDPTMVNDKDTTHRNGDKIYIHEGEDDV